MRYTVFVETFAITFGHPPVQRIAHRYDTCRWLWSARLYVWLVNHTPMAPGLGVWETAKLL